MDEETDRIIYPKELRMNLDQKELLELKDQLYLSKIIQELEYLYYDQEQNIIIGIIKEDNNSKISEVSYTKELMEDSNTYKAFGDTPFDRTVKHETVSCGGGFPPRGAYPFYNNTGEKYIARGSEKPLEKKIEFQSDHKAQILNITAHDPQTWNNVIDVWKKYHNRTLY